MIPFRTQRLATTVVNRIMNLADDLAASAPASPRPSAPDPLPVGAELDAALAQPVEPVTADPAVAEEVALTTGGLL